MISLIPSNLRALRHRKSHSMLLHINIQDLWISYEAKVLLLALLYGKGG